jgi:uncharacterized membrane protein
MILDHILLAVFWIIFCVLHSVLASITMKTWVQKKTPGTFRYYRLFYTLFAAVTLGAVLYYQLTIDSIKAYEQSLLTNIIGGITASIGLALMVICIKKYFLSLSGLKSLYREEPSSELMIAGIHR